MIVTREASTLRLVDAGAPAHNLRQDCGTPGFGADLLVETEAGLLPLGTIRRGRQVRSPDRSLTEVLAVVDFEPEASGECVLIGAGSLGIDGPARDIQVSPRQDIVLQAGLIEELTGSPAARVTADQLCVIPDVARIPANPAKRLHLVLDRPQGFTIAGLTVLGFMPEPQAVAALTVETRTALHEALPASRYAGGLAAYESDLPRLEDRELAILRQMGEIGASARVMDLSGAPVSALGSGRAG